MATMFWDCEGLRLCEFLPLKTCKKPLNKRDQDDYLLERGFCSMEHNLTLQPRQQPDCKRSSAKSTHGPDPVPSEFFLGYLKTSKRSED
jgi:hypothetical protein